MKLIKKCAQGADGIYVSLPDYMVDTGVAGKQPLGHGFVISVNEDTGNTRGSEYGRYDAENKGLARRVKVPNFKMENAGNPTEEELHNYGKKVLESYKKKNPKAGNAIKITYVKGADEDKMNKMMESAETGNRKNGYYINKDYNILSHNCGTYGVDMINKATPWYKFSDLPMVSWGTPSGQHPNNKNTVLYREENTTSPSMDWNTIWKSFKKLFK